MSKKSMVFKGIAQSGIQKKITNSRFLELEGLRGVAAIVVVVFHFLVLFYPSMFYGSQHPFSPIQHMRFEDNLFGLPSGAFVSGAFAVAVFFVLSGFVLSVGFFQKNDVGIVRRLAVKRYIRLMLPALASIMVIWLILQLELDSGKLAAEGLSLAGSSMTLWAFEPNFFEALRQGIIGIFVTTLGTDHYNPVLWTMQYEFIGSFLVFLLAILFGASKHRWIVYAIAIFFTWNTWYLGFFLGMILADLYVYRQYVYGVGRRWWIALLLILSGIYLGGFPYVGGSPYYDWLRGGLDQSVALPLYLTIGATLLVFSVIAVPTLRGFLRKPFVSSLGRYTFALYLTHLAVLFTIYPAVFMLLYSTFGYNWSVLMAIITSIPVIIGVTWVFERFVDTPAIKLSSIFAQWFEGGARKIQKKEAEV